MLLESKSFQHTKERICSPQCCCILSRRTAQSKVTSTFAPTSSGASHSCQRRPSFSLACNTFTPLILPLSLNCPPPSGKITVWSSSTKNLPSLSSQASTVAWQFLSITLSLYNFIVMVLPPQYSHCITFTSSML